MTETQVLPPVVRSVLVSWSREAAFRRFTDEFAGRRTAEMRGGATPRRRRSHHMPRPDPAAEQ